MPGLLKGRIDRVLANGWAYDYGPDARLVKKLRHLPVHLVAIGGADTRTYARHGYFSAMKTQIDHGIFDYCGPCVVTSELMLDSDTRDPTSHLDAARAVGRSLSSIHPSEARRPRQHEQSARYSRPSPMKRRRIVLEPQSIRPTVTRIRRMMKAA